MYKPNLVEGPQGKSSSGICQYGTMREGVLQGDNYIYSINGTVVKAEFCKNQCGYACLMIPHALNRETKVPPEAYTIHNH